MDNYCKICYLLSQLIFCKMTTYTERIANLEVIDPVFSNEIKTFFQQNPIFAKWSDLIPYSRYPIGYGLNHFETKSLYQPKNILEFIIHYICEAGVNSTYADKQWQMFIPWLRSSDYDLISMVEIFPQIQPKKKQIYIDLGVYLVENNLKNITLKDCENIYKCVKGVGIGCINEMKYLFGGDEFKSSVDCIAISDRGFISGFRKVYGDARIKDVISTWGDFKNIGSAMCFQIFRYG